MQGSPESGGIVCRIWKFLRESVFYRRWPTVACAGIRGGFRQIYSRIRPDFLIPATGFYRLIAEKWWLGVRFTGSVHCLVSLGSVLPGRSGDTGQTLFAV